MPISELLAAQRRWGRTRSRKFLGQLGLSENKRIGTLTGASVAARVGAAAQVGPFAA